MRIFKFLLVLFVLMTSPILYAQFHRVESVVKVGDPQRNHVGYTSKLSKGGKLLIEPKSQLYNAYNYQDSYAVPFDYGYGSYFDGVGDLSLVVHMVNNTKYSVDISQLKIEIENSRLDTHPYISMRTDIISPCTIVLFNEGWGKWNKALIEIDIYTPSMHECVSVKECVQYFDTVYELNMFDAVFDLVDKHSSREVGNAENRILQKKQGFFDNEMSEQIQSIWREGTADFVGHIIIDDKYSISLYGELPLIEGFIMVGASALKTYAGKYSVRLKPDEKNYSYNIPYFTHLPPGGSEWVILEIECDKSSIHDFSIKVCDIDEKILSKTDIELHYYEPWKIGRRR